MGRVQHITVVIQHSRALSQAGWSKRTAQQNTKEQNPQLRDFYQHKLSEFRSYHLVFVDESGCDTVNGRDIGRLGGQLINGMYFVIQYRASLLCFDVL
jgi:hypothetical protein